MYSSLQSPPMRYFGYLSLVQNLEATTTIVNFVWLPTHTHTQCLAVQSQALIMSA